MDNDVKQSADLMDFMAWFQVNRTKIVSIAVIVVVVGAVVGGYYWHQSYNETQAAVALSSIKPPTSVQGVSTATDAQPYQRVAEDYPGTRAAGRALLIAGGIWFDAGKFDQAKAAFEKFLRDFPEDLLADQAIVGVAACLEAEGKTAEAVSRYEDFVKSHPGDPTLPQAKSALARLYVAENKPDLAMHQYEDLARGGNGDTWSSEAGIQLEELLAKYPNLRKPAAPSAPPMASPKPTTPPAK